MNYAEALCLFFKYLWVVFFFQISFCYKRVIVRQQVVVVWSLSHVRLFCDSINCSLPGSSVHGISKATVLEWVPFPSPRDLPCPEIEPVSSAWQEESLALSHLGSPLRQHTSYNFSSQFIVRPILLRRLYATLNSIFHHFSLFVSLNLSCIHCR